MKLIQLEMGKILGKRFSLLLLIISAILFPILVKIISHLNAVEDNVPEGLYAIHVAFGVIAYSQTYFFLPVWLIIFTGQEFSNGHVNRIVFETSKQFYFKSKIVYCGLITVFFTVIGLLSLVISIAYSPFPDLNINVGFYFQFLFQMAVATFSFSILLLALVFVFQSPTLTFVIYLGCNFIEGIIYTSVKGIYKIEMVWLPFHLVKTFYSRNGESSVDYYHFPFTETPTSLIAPSLFVFFLLLFSYHYFSRNSLKTLSD